ncbi:MAG TPA: tetratricopeptide repeat protein [Candidatus Dormibacteraeota bacterium]|nr:tetratricopeptide repeat protein [Candidatus Dormibacteraeota bacterium]
MAFNKNKALESALKYLSQGKPAQAIAEYQQILRHDGKDQATLMTVGDLFARQGDMTQAVEYFERLAQVYLNDGFNSKAIAIYKKIAKLAPNELAPLERLADLYVQQGVLSEARPLFLQIAEAHLKANHAPKAVEVLNRLLEVEPDNPRVQTRLAELYNVMGQKKEAAQTYFNYAQRLFEREETDEAQKLIARAIELEPQNPGTLLLEAKIFHLANKTDKAVAVLAKHPDADAGGEVTNLLVDWQLAAGHFEQAADRARNQLLRGSSHIGLLQKVLDHQIENGHAAEALPLLAEIREPAIEAGEQERFLKSLVAITEKAPGNVEALQLLADFSRHTSDPFQLSSALNRLVDAYSAQGDYPRAEESLQELIEKNKGDERLQERLEQLRARANGEVLQPAPAEMTGTSSAAMPIASDDQIASIFEVSKEAEEEHESQAANAIPEEPLDDETQLYIAQALTDVDLFSSYGLTQKATVLLETVLERAPRHAPTLERLLDLYVGAGNNRRTAELAAQLEQIHLQRDDSANAERFTEIRERYEKLAGLTREDLQSAAAQPPAATPSAKIAAPQKVEVPPAPAPETLEVNASAPAPLEFEIPITPVGAEAAAEEIVVPRAAAPEPELSARPAAAPTEEVDLSDEWEAMVQEVSEPAKADEALPQEIALQPETPSVPEPAEIAPAVVQFEAEPKPEAEPEPEPEPVNVPLAEEESADELPIELVLEPAFQADEEEQEAPQEAAEELATARKEIELELTPQPAASNGNQASNPKTADDFLSELNAELDAMEPPVSVDPAAPKAATPAAPQPGTKEVKEPVRAASKEPVQTAPPAPAVAASIAPPEPSPESLNQLAEVFQEFRNELGEMPDEDEDLETHYNLGIAYREMGLLDEAIGEFQKVAQAVQRGKPFPYAMNCAAMLALSFMGKGEPKIASLWYERALKTSGLDQDAILALRYDLGLSLESAGESAAALDHFRQVYAMNIDYRDVADRIAMLQKH